MINQRNLGYGYGAVPVFQLIDHEFRAELQGAGAMKVGVGSAKWRQRDLDDLVFHIAFRALYDDRAAFFAPEQRTPDR